MFNILIIGSKGFIGNALKNYLISQEYSVWECDLVPDYSNQKYFQIHKISSDLPEILKTVCFDFCVNCSGAADVSLSLTNPIRDFELNATNVFIILNSIRLYSPKSKLLNISSAAVYGNPTDIPIVESSSINPISPYGYHKKIAELISTEFHKIYDLKVTNLRVFSAYGPGLKKQIFWDLYMKSKKSTEIILPGTGDESRDFIYIEDLVSSINCILKNSKFENDFINIANGVEVKIKDAVKLFYNLLDFKYTWKFSGKGMNGYPQRWLGDNLELKKLGYSQKVSLNEGLELYIKWIKNYDRI